MQPYRIQRAINKIYYEHAIKIIEKVIKKEYITKFFPLINTIFIF